MNVDRLMRTDVKVCSIDDTLADAARVMWEHDCGCVPIVSDKGMLVGMLTDRDVCMAAFLNDMTIRHLPVEKTMSKNLVTCFPHEDVRDAEEKMRAAQVRRIPVVDGVGKVVGILSLNDIALEAAREQAVRKPQITLTEVGQTLSAVCKPHAIPSPLAV